MTGQSNQPATGSNEDASETIRVLERAFARERERRREAEKLLEDRSRELYARLEELSQANDALTQANSRLVDQATVIDGLSNNYQRVTAELKVAAKTQLDLLPPPIDTGDLIACGMYRPAEFVAGDGYDYFPLDDQHLAFYMLDVAGHGAAAAMVSFAAQFHLNPKLEGLCQTRLRSSTSLQETVASTLGELNQAFYMDHGSVRYFTMIYGVMNRISGRACIGHAGHPIPMLYRTATGTVEQHGEGGHPVAMFESPQFSTVEFTMQAGDRLLIYSDGATECTNSSNEEFGTSRLADAIQQTSALPLQGVGDHLLHELTKWTGTGVFEDDLAALLIEFRGASANADGGGDV